MLLKLGFSFNSEIFSSIYRCDRKSHGGGVLIAVSNSFPSRLVVLSHNTSILWLWIYFSILRYFFVVFMFLRQVRMNTVQPRINAQGLNAEPIYVQIILIVAHCVSIREGIKPPVTAIMLKVVFLKWIVICLMNILIWKTLSM